MTRRDYLQVTESIAFGAARNASAEPDLATRRRALFGSAIGSAVEWYDYFLYGTMAGIVFGPLFFPSANANVSLMLSFASFALAFVVRPVGGILFSHIGDRIGRKKTLVVTLSLMGGSTMLIGFLPQYASIGIWAPILLTLLRLIQGLALGGEWGGGLLLAVEYAPKSRRGLYGAIPMRAAATLPGTITWSGARRMPSRWRSRSVVPTRSTRSAGVWVARSCRLRSRYCAHGGTRRWQA